MDHRRPRLYLATAVVSAALLALLYLVFVRTSWGQQFDDIAFDGRQVEDPDLTRATNELLHRVTRSSLFLMTGALVAFALARRRWRLALVAGASITAAVVTTEVLKLHLLTRPDLDGIAGINQNSFPSGHATIGMSLSLGLVMVSPHTWRWLATIIALVASMSFGIGVLATGWHRPSDVLGAYLVCIVMFSLGTALLLWWRGSGIDDMGGIEGRLNVRVAALAGGLVVAAAVFTLVETFTHDSFRTIEFAIDYLAMSVVILVLAAIIVIGYHESLRGVSLDPPPAQGDHTPHEVAEHG